MNFKAVNNALVHKLIDGSNVYQEDLNNSVS